jgi:hypothetical protein
MDYTVQTHTESQKEKEKKQTKTITKSVYPALALLALGCFAVLERAQATDLGGVLPGGNTADGAGVLTLLTTGFGNSGFGVYALYNDRIGSQNTATGYGALYMNNGFDNSAFGFAALPFNTTGGANTAIGSWALFRNETGFLNTATGVRALESNTAGTFNTAQGARALDGNTTGGGNTATGASALESNTTGNYNTAAGLSALRVNHIGSYNTATGDYALNDNDTGSNNTANGDNTLFNNNGDNNTAIGARALYSNTTGQGSMALGVGAGSNLTTGDNNIDIGNAGVAGESNTIRIGTQGTHMATYVAGIFGATVTEGVGVIVDTNGHLGTAVSSMRFKDEIKPMGKASEAILALKPVTFRYKSGKTNTPQFGLIAEDVAEVNPDLIVRDKGGKPYTVRYDQINAMLLNEFLKEHRTVQEQQKEIDVLKAKLKEQAAQIQKVNARFELGKPAPQTVLNDP